MMTEKFRKEREKELLEYIRLRMKEIREKYSDNIIINNERFSWSDEYYAEPYNLEIATLQRYVDDTVFEAFPSLDFLKFLKFSDEITIEGFDFAKWWLDALEAWLGYLYTQAKKEEEKILKELHESKSYQEYRSLKVMRKLEGNEEPKE